MYILHKNLQKKEKYTQKGKYSPFQERMKTALHQHVKKIELKTFLKAEKIQLWFIISHRSCFYTSLLIQKYKFSKSLI